MVPGASVKNGKELEGYVEYAQRVRYRLVRGIW